MSISASSTSPSTQCAICCEMSFRFSKVSSFTRGLCDASSEMVLFSREYQVGRVRIGWGFLMKEFPFGKLSRIEDARLYRQSVHPPTSSVGPSGSCQGCCSLGTSVSAIRANLRHFFLASPMFWTQSASAVATVRCSDNFRVRYLKDPLGTHSHR